MVGINCCVQPFYFAMEISKGCDSFLFWKCYFISLGEAFSLLIKNAATNPPEIIHHPLRIFANANHAGTFLTFSLSQKRC